MKTLREKTISSEAVQVSTPDNMIMIALNAGRSMEEIKELIKLRNDEIARLARIEFIKAKKEFQRICPAITKDSEAGWDHKSGAGKTNYWFASLQHVENTVKEPLGSCGFSYDWKTSYENSDIIITCILSHESGHVEVDSMKAPADTSGGKNFIQAGSSTVSYLKRYTLLNVTGKSSGKDDNDGRSVNVTVQGESAKNFSETMKNVRAGKITVDEASRFYQFSPEQIESLRVVESQIAKP